MKSTPKPVFGKNSAAAKLTAVIALILMLAGIQSGHAQLNMLFTNNPSSSGYDSSNIWVTILRGQSATSPVTDAPDITFADNTNDNPFSWTMVTNTVYQFDTNGDLTNTATTVGQGYSESIPLSEIISEGGLRWYSNASSAQVVISYGQQIDSTNITYQTINSQYTNSIAFYATGQLAANNPSDPSYTIPYQNFEITYTGTNVGDQGDITAINAFGSLVGISSFSSTNATGTPLQTVGYLTNANISSIVSNFTNTFGTNGYGNTTTSTIVTNNLAQIVRLVGPSTFGGAGNGLGGYTNLSSYLGYVQSSTYSNTLLSNNSGYNTVAGGSISGYQSNVIVSFNMTNQVTGTASNGFGLDASGNITMVITEAFNGAAISTNTNTFNGITIQVPSSYTNGSNSYPTAAAQFIYGASSGKINYFTQNAGYSNFQTAMAPFVDGAGTNGFVDVTSQIQGELSSAFAFGLAGSTNLTTNGQIIGGMESDQWWVASNGIIPFAGVQTNSAYYNQWASLIYAASSNGVYGYAYSDRLGGNTPLINDLQYISNGVTNPVDSWLITVGAPLTSPVPEPSTYGLLGLGAIGLLSVVMRRRNS